MRVRKRQPVHPGGILKRHYLEPLGLSISKVAVALEPVQDIFIRTERKAKTTICAEVSSLRSQFFQSLRHFSNQPKERSTIHRFGNTTNL